MSVGAPPIPEQDGASTALRRALLAALTAELRLRQRRPSDALGYAQRLARRVREVLAGAERPGTSLDEVTTRREALTERSADQLSTLTEHLRCLEWVFARLADEHSRSQFVDLLTWRITGQDDLLPTAWRRQRGRQAVAVDRDFRRERQPYGSLLPGLHRYRIPGTTGEIDLRARRDDIWRTFFAERYAYEHDGSIIRAEHGQVVIDAESRWGDSALYFADRVGHSGEVHAIEPDVRCAAVIRENCAHNPDLGYQTVVSVRALSDRDGEWRSYPADGALRLLMRPDSWEPSLAQTPTTSIDAYVEQHGISRLDYIKLDVPGLAKVVDGARASIERFRPTLAIALATRMKDLIAIQPVLLEIADQYDFFLDHFNGDDASIVLFARPHAPRPRG